MLVSPQASLLHSGPAVTGKWIVYSNSSSATGQGGLFVQPFPGPGLRRQVAASPGIPYWRADDREILVAGATRLSSIAVSAREGQLQCGPPVEPFSGLRAPVGGNAASRPLAATRDGTRIYWPMAVEQPGSDVIHIRTNALR